MFRPLFARIFPTLPSLPAQDPSEKSSHLAPGSCSSQHHVLQKQCSDYSQVPLVGLKRRHPNLRKRDLNTSAWRAHGSFSPALLLSPCFNFNLCKTGPHMVPKHSQTGWATQRPYNQSTERIFYLIISSLGQTVHTASDRLFSERIG